MARVLRKPRVEEDLIDIWVWIARDNPAAADRVLDAIDETLALLATQPTMGVRHVSTLKRLTELRFFPTNRYRSFLIYYRALSDGIEVVRVLRAERDREKALAEEG